MLGQVYVLMQAWPIDRYTTLCQSLSHGGHAVLWVAVYQEGGAWLARMMMPCQQFVPVGVGRKTVNRMDAGVHLNRFPENVNGFCPVNDAPSECHRGSETHKDDTAVPPPQMVF